MRKHGPGAAALFVILAFFTFNLPPDVVTALSTCFDSSEMKPGRAIFRPPGLKMFRRILKFNHIQEPGRVLLSKFLAQAFAHLLAQGGVKSIPVPKLIEECASMWSL